MKINFKHEKNGENLVIAIAQDYKSLEVLMVAFMNEEALSKTIQTKKAHYFSTSRNKLWLKGESSNNFQHVKEILIDCDMDAILLKVNPDGASCHEGYNSCFFRELDGDKIAKKSYNLDKLDEEDLKIIQARLFNPEDVYK
ncbi:phosphoribosyl-AMP cyclohydrolase [Methanobrevibacter curvatus]|uniref:Phosphoribosyl-AMP cyclohydrolase n=1 Tax=Methanobrevibacter curvatus TaxID=49547 RepID=A0A166ERG5_9EURY|nr:phosphoribosyl-AMP cyclohydrolase [Methanobrevibacter curvatus]KZX16931.1 phosphoribosyl-AMP cyclohydrolase [Methanobrevibacter curvatus]